MCARIRERGLDGGEILDWSFRTRATELLVFLRATPLRAARRAVEGGGVPWACCGDALHVRNASLKDVWQLTYVAMYA